MLNLVNCYFNPLNFNTHTYKEKGEKVLKKLTIMYIQKGSPISLHILSPLVLPSILITFFLLKKEEDSFLSRSFLSLVSLVSLFRSMHLGGPHDLAWIRNNRWILPKAKLITLPQSSNAAHDKDLGTVPRSPYDSTLVTIVANLITPRRNLSLWSLLVRMGLKSD